MIFDTKFTVIVRDELAVWQKLNVAAFLTPGVAAQLPEIMGEPYRDRDGNVFNRLPIQPLVVMAADGALLATIHRRAIERGVAASVYLEEMFATGHDTLNRSTFAQFGADDAKIVGLALRAPKKLVDKITKGARLHA